MAEKVTLPILNAIKTLKNVTSLNTEFHFQYGGDKCNNMKTLYIKFRSKDITLAFDNYALGQKTTTTISYNKFDDFTMEDLQKNLNFNFGEEE